MKELKEQYNKEFQFSKLFLNFYQKSLKSQNLQLLFLDINFLKLKLYFMVLNLYVLSNFYVNN